MKQFTQMLLWIALYFIRLPYQRIQIIRQSRIQANLRASQSRTYGAYHVIGDQRSWFEKSFNLESPSHARDLRVNIVVIVACLQVMFILLVTAASQPTALLLIPTFCLYTAAMLAYRQYRLSNLAS